MPVSMVSTIEDMFVNTLALLVKENTMNPMTDYKRGWLEGYAKAYTQMTGHTVFVLVRKVNESLEGSGKSINL